MQTSVHINLYKALLGSGTVEPRPQLFRCPPKTAPCMQSAPGEVAEGPAYQRIHGRPPQPGCRFILWPNNKMPEVAVAYICMHACVLHQPNPLLDLVYAPTHIYAPLALVGLAVGPTAAAVVTVAALGDGVRAVRRQAGDGVGVRVVVRNVAACMHACRGGRKS